VATDYMARVQTPLGTLGLFCTPLPCPELFSNLPSPLSNIYRVKAPGALN